MGRSLLSADNPLEARVAELERIIGDLTAARRLGDSSQRGGVFQLLAPDGGVLLDFGDYDGPDAGAGYGVTLRDAAGSPVVAIDEDVTGAVWPGDNSAWGTTAPQAITSGTFADYHNTVLYGLNGDTLYLEGSLTCDVGTTAEVRLRYYSGGTIYSNTLAMSSSNARWTCAWAHPFPVGWQPSVSLVQPIYLEVRRASGAGNVYVYRPSTCWVTSSRVVAGTGPTPTLVAV